MNCCYLLRKLPLSRLLFGVLLLGRLESQILNPLKKQVLNPFEIDVPISRHLEIEDYQLIQNKLHEIDINFLIQGLLQGFGNLPHKDYESFYNRCSRGLHQKFFDLKTGHLPERKIISINGGGPNCIISSAPFSKDYPTRLEEQIRDLEYLGFQGTYIAYKGALPTPTGEEPRLAGVPYVFKIFAIRDAFELGHECVMWLDAAMSPLRSLDPLFEEIEQSGFLAHTVEPDRYKWGSKTVFRHRLQGWGRHIFPKTRQLLQNLTGVDVLAHRHFIAACIGMHKKHPLTQQFLDHYYELARLGTPFLSDLPEEFVISAMLAEPRFTEWGNLLPKFSQKYKFFFDIVPGDPPEAWGQSRNEGCYFFWRSHRHPDNIGCSPNTSA